MPIATKFRRLASMARPVGGGITLPGAAEITVTDEPGLPYDLTATVELHDLRYRCTKLECRQKAGGEPVTTNGIRGVPLGYVIARGLEGHVMKFTATGKGFTGAPVGAWDDELVLVAAIYRLAYACGLPPTRSVAERLEVGQSAAGKKVMAARKAGLLGEATPGRAGERGGA